MKLKSTKTAQQTGICTRSATANALLDDVTSRCNVIMELTIDVDSDVSAVTGTDVICGSALINSSVGSLQI